VCWVYSVLIIDVAAALRRQSVCVHDLKIKDCCTKEIFGQLKVRVVLNSACSSIRFSYFNIERIPPSAICFKECNYFAS
jgi:hypothetical protein